MSAPAEATVGGPAGSTNLGKRKKPRGKSSYLGTWLERAARHLQEEPDFEYLPHNPYGVPNVDPCRLNGFCPPEPMSLPTYPFYSPAPPYPAPYWPQDCRFVQSAHKSVQVQRPRLKKAHNGQQNGTATNGTYNSYLQPKQLIEENNEFASLPPIVTSVGDTTSTSDVNNDKESESARRFSDPCLARLNGAGERNGSGSEEGEGSVFDTAGGNKLLMCLVDQINGLKVANERLNKDLQETRAELQTVRQQTSPWQKGSSSSIGGLQHHPINNNGYVASPSQYTPGVLSELVREIREAARLREEALYARVRTMLDERTLNQSGLSCSLDKSIDSRNYEDIKSELRAAEADKRRMNERLSRLELELRHIRNGNGSAEEGEGGESDRLRLRRELSDTRRELQDARRAKQQADDNTLKLERLVTQMRSKFNGLHVSSPGPASLAASEAEAESPGAPPRVRRTSTASNTSPHTTIVYGPVTDL